MLFRDAIFKIEPLCGRLWPRGSGVRRTRESGNGATTGTTIRATGGSRDLVG